MKNAQKVLTYLLMFAVAQALIVCLLFLGVKADLVKAYRAGVESNFLRMAQVAEASDDWSELYLYNFQNVLLVDGSGEILKLSQKTSSLTVGGYFNVDVGFAEAEGVTLNEASVLGTRSLIVAKRLGGNVLVAYEGLSVSEQYFARVQLTRQIVAAVLQTVLLAGFALLLTKGRADGGERYIPKRSSADGTSRFVFYIDRAGRVLWEKRNPFFAHFDIKNISEHYADAKLPLIKVLSSKLPFCLLLPNKEGGKNFYHCLGAKCSAGYRILAIDYTAQYQENKRAAEHIFLEPLTGLKNRSALELDLEQCLGVDKREQRALTVFNIRNIDNLETLFSRAVKEKVLKNCAQLFKRRYPDIESIYFFDHNKIAVLTVDSASTAEVKSTISEFNGNLNAITKIDKNNVQIITDVIFLLFDGTAKDASLDEILEYNDYLVLNAKMRINASIVSDIFTKSKYYHAIGSKKEVTKRIIEEGSFSLFYQPQTSVEDGRLVSFEALVRLNEKAVSTQDFILISEVNGYMLQLGDLIMTKAFEFARRIRAAGMTVSMNLSPIQLLNKGFVDSFLKKYKEYGLDDKSIALEITETFLMSDVAENIKKLQILHDNGIKLHLDDFGMGYSSLAYLKNFPVDTIKIDKEFIKEITEDSHSRAITTFMVSAAKELGIRTVAEGVERQEQLACLREIGCDLAQGYLTGKAIDEAGAIALIERSLGVRI